MKTLREYIDIVTEAPIDPFDLLSNQDLLSINQSLDNEVREETSDRDQTIDEIISRLTPEQKKTLRTKLNQEIKQRKANPQKAPATPPAKSSILPKIIASIVIGSAIYGAMPDEKTSTPAAVTAPIPKHKQVEVIDFSWTRETRAFLTVNFKIKNNLAIAVKDIEVQCGGYAESGTRIDSNVRTIYKTIAPGKTLSVNDFDMGFLHTQVEKVGCTVKDFTPVGGVKEQVMELEESESDDPISKIDRLFRDA